MARPGFASKLPKLPPDYSSVREPATRLPPPKLQPPNRPGEPTSLDLASATWTRSLQLHLETDMEFDPLRVDTHTTYFQDYVPGHKASIIEPLSLLYCNFCWNRWPVVAIFSMDKLTLIRFLRGQCCPSCRDDPSRFDINSTLTRIGPSKYFIEQAQRLGMRTNRFPYLKIEEELRFADIWSVNATNVGYAKDLWEAVRPLVPPMHRDV